MLVDTDFSIESGERVCLIGRNGTGKSTLMKIVSGEYQPDRGDIQYRDNLRISVLDQQLPVSGDEIVFDIVRQGLARQIQLIEDFRKLSDQTLDQNGLKDLEELQSMIEAGGGWQPDQQVETIVSQLDLPAYSKMSDLSGGWCRRVALAQALVSNPELLMLDEPTNHLDISTIEWLEHVVRGFRGSVIFVTHDRTFLEKLATRIVEIDRGKLISWPGSYRDYLDLKEKANEEEDVRNALFDKRLEQEESWIRQGVKARRTRNEGRVRALQAMREERARRI
ncbi:MAG: ATP-binding cassette domain-containing protein [Pseudomonadales bacterium]